MSKGVEISVRLGDRVSGTDIHHLRPLAKLRRLELLRNVHITRAGVEALKKKLPNCEIHFTVNDKNEKL